MIDGTREIVGKMPDGQPRSIMNSSVGEAIEIFKNQLLEQEEVELTELQKKQIKEHEPKEAKGEQGETPEEKPEQDDKPEGEDKPSGDDEPGAEDTPEGDDRPGMEDEPKTGGDDGDTGGGDDGGGDGGDSGGGEEGGARDGDGEKPKDLGGEDIPRVSGGGGGGGVPPPPLDIPEDAFPIPRLTEEVESVLDRWSHVNFEWNVSKRTTWVPAGKSLTGGEHPDLFMYWSIDQWIAVWNIYCWYGYPPVEPVTLRHENLFSLIQYKWEKIKGKETKALDRYYIYSQYTNFLLFFLNAEKTRFFGSGIMQFYSPDGKSTGKVIKIFPDRTVFSNGTDSVFAGDKLKPSSLLKPLENYKRYLSEAGFYAGDVPQDVNDTLMKHLPRATGFLEPFMPAVFTETDDEKKQRLFEMKSFISTVAHPKTTLLYTNGFRQDEPLNDLGVTVAHNDVEMLVRYVEMLRFNSLSLASNRNALQGKTWNDVYRVDFKEDNPENLVMVNEFSSKDILMKYNGLHSTETSETRELEKPYEAFLLIKKTINAASFFKSNPKEQPYLFDLRKFKIFPEELKLALGSYLKFNRNLDGLGRSVLLTFASTRWLHSIGPGYDTERVYIHDETSDGTFNPDPENPAWEGEQFSHAYSIAWKKSMPLRNSVLIPLPGLAESGRSSAGIKMKPAEQPPATPPTPPRTKRPSRARKQKSDEYKAVEAEIKSLKSALKYLPKEEQDEIRREIEALTQSLKHI